ncbi:phage tail protein [Citrobacter freundii]|uniref:phage tail protein n=1 Tax=Citrobacter freundii TaxID=546 RepID=UPI0028BF39C3|nr:phage tail protein [Citrobacter freundii]MDT7344273.1 phage tail protein [Citrobacter freundii]
MATKYLALLTNIGAAKLAKATALGTKVEITQLAVGDGNGVLPTPNPAQTALVHELRRAPLNMLTVDPANASQIIAEQVIPEDVGGWWIREIGLFDKDGDMVAIANCAETYKPQLQEGSGRVQVIRVILIVSSTEAVTLKIDPAVVLATRQYVDSQLRAHEQSRNHPDASTTEKGFVQLSSSVTSDSESQAATSKAVKIAMDNANARLAKERNLADLPNPALARQNLQLGDSSTKNTGTTANTVAAGDDARITGAMQKSQNGADIPDVAKFLQNLGLGGVLHLGDYGVGKAIQSSAAQRTHVGSFFYEPGVPGSTLYPVSVAVTESGGPTPGEWVQLAISYGADFRVFVGHQTYGGAPEISELFHDKRKPTNSDVGSYPATGGTLQGSLAAEGSVQGGPGYDVVSQQDIWAGRNIYESGKRVFSPNNHQPVIADGQTWVDVTASRQLGATYTNTTGRPIQMLLDFVRPANDWHVGVKIDNVAFSNGGGSYCPIIPAGSSYSVLSAGISQYTWRELR